MRYSEEDNESMNLDKLDITKRPVMDDVTVLIPTLGRDILEKCLHSIATGTVWPSKLIIVDQGSNFKVDDWVHALQCAGIDVEHVRSSQTGVAAGRNRGIEAVRTLFVVVTDDDCLTSPDWLERMMIQLRGNPEVIITGRVDPGEEGVAVSVRTSNIPVAYTRPSLKGCVLLPGNMGCAISIFNRVGGFDESGFLRYAEDDDWSYRTLRAGIPTIYAPDVVVKHFHWRDEGQISNTYRNYARSVGGFYGKHLRRGDCFIALSAIITFSRGVRRWLRGVIRSDASLSANGFAYMTELVPGIIAGFRGAK